MQGVWEKDEIRKDDSFTAFEEILQVASDQEVDLLLLGGDLFHDNKPSRSTIVRTIEILTKYSLSDRPVAFQILSNQSQNFVSGYYAATMLSLHLLALHNYLVQRHNTRASLQGCEL